MHTLSAVGLDQRQKGHPESRASGKGTPGTADFGLCASKGGGRPQQAEPTATCGKWLRFPFRLSLKLQSPRNGKELGAFQQRLCDPGKSSPSLSLIICF